MTGYLAEVLDRVDIGELATGLASSPGVPALFCVERDPEACHRSLIAARLAERYDLEVDHIRP